MLPTRNSKVYEPVLDMKSAYGVRSVTVTKAYKLPVGTQLAPIRAAQTEPMTGPQE